MIIRIVATDFETARSEAQKQTDRLIVLSAVYRLDGPQRFQRAYTFRPQTNGGGC